MFVLDSYKILNNHNIYKDTFIQALHYIHYNTYIKLITLLYKTKIILISWIPACQLFPISSFEWISLNVENTFSTPALAEVAPNNWSISVSSLSVCLLLLWMPPGNGTNWIHYFSHKHVLVEWACLRLIVYYAGHQIRIVYQYMFHGLVCFLNT